MRLFQNAFNQLADLRSVARGFNTKLMKRAIGDSINNNRTLTVNQAIRFANKVGLYTLASTLEVTASILETEILEARVSRTDAIDLNELVSTYRNLIMVKKGIRSRKKTRKSLRRKIGLALAKVS